MWVSRPPTRPQPSVAASAAPAVASSLALRPVFLGGCGRIGNFSSCTGGESSGNSVLSGPAPVSSPHRASHSDPLPQAAARRSSSIVPRFLCLS